MIKHVSLVRTNIYHQLALAGILNLACNYLGLSSASNDTKQLANAQFTFSAQKYIYTHKFQPADKCILSQSSSSHRSHQAVRAIGWLLHYKYVDHYQQ